MGFPKVSNILRTLAHRLRTWFKKSGLPYIYNYFSKHHDLHLVEKTSYYKLRFMKFPPVLSGIERNKSNGDITIRPRARTRDNKNIDHGASEEVVTSTCFDHSTSIYESSLHHFAPWVTHVVKTTATCILMILHGG